MPKNYTYYFDSRKIRSLRIASGMTQREVATACGLDLAGLRTIEDVNQKKPIKRGVIEALATFYGVSTRELFVTKSGRTPHAGRPRNDRSWKFPRKVPSRGRQRERALQLEEAL